MNKTAFDGSNLLSPTGVAALTAAATIGSLRLAAWLAVMFAAVTLLILAGMWVRRSRPQIVQSWHSPRCPHRPGSQFRLPGSEKECRLCVPAFGAGTVVALMAAVAIFLSAFSWG